MTSQEIRKLQTDEPKWEYQGVLEFWLAEIALQLALLNEMAAPRRRKL